MNIPKFPLGEYIEAVIDFLVEQFSGLTNWLADIIQSGYEVLTDVLLILPAPVMVLIFLGLAFLITRKPTLSITASVGLLFVWNLDLWAPTMQTIALVSLATLIAVGIGIPLGILASISIYFRRVIMPILDFMQTLPAFVYLIPAIPFFGLGATSAIFSTVIFSMPPAIRLTTLGISQVPADLVEAANAFGSTRMQKLVKLQLPLAMPAIRTGINQTILLALSMVVIAAMIGAEGLGSEVWEAIQRLEPGDGFEAGISIVVIAIILDRVIQNIGAKSKKAAAAAK